MWGSSSHNTLFRNWFEGWRASPSGYVAFRVAVRIGPYSRYYNLVGNVASVSAWTTGKGLCGQTDDCVYPAGLQFGYHTNASYLDSQAYATAIIHGNYDYVTDGVGNWADADHEIADSLYYPARPIWYGGCDSAAHRAGCRWDAQDIPAQLRFAGDTCPTVVPTAPARLRIIP